ncbi:serine/threonine protein phosphatase [Dysgonomonas sp. 216]|uniref:metallophosphoesterase n=1 Tax=Dysgonomonas sp. 216 TaxID=2302934 RepID=UPI0013D23135|nr:metallophosphoesterase [Dysgonomonas sp. 216]NDW19407.1 serine/threonine protein phosphatase [Dysgonomonas sp. 216]
MKIQYASDLHLEFHDNSRFLKENPLLPAGEILILAGDIGYLNDDNYNKHPFWDWASENYKQVIVAVGNHELYKYYDLAEMPQGLVCSIRDNVKCYYNAVVRIENVDIIVSTLWAKIPLEEAYPTERGVTDFHRILYKGETLTFADFNREHDKCFHFIQNEVARSTADHIIVITHHVPSFQLASPDFAGSKINGAFTVELKSFIENSPIEYWIYGHSHRNIDKVIGKTQCVSNQLGYVFHNEHHTFDPGKVIEIG